MNIDSSQSGDNAVPAGFYRRILQELQPRMTLLNLGCGSLFTFESLAHDHGIDHVVSVDLQTPDKIPKFVTFLNRDVESAIDFGSEFDVVTFFEVIEHVDKTDELLRNCYNALKPNGVLAFSFPNLASAYSRFELLLGLQPHVLEVSNENAVFGSGLPGRMNNPTGVSIHHIRGITHRAMRELVAYHGFVVERAHGVSMKRMNLFNAFPTLAPNNIFICRKLADSVKESEAPQA